MIGADVEEPDVIEAQLRQVTVKLQPSQTAKDLVWELTQLFPDETVIIQ